MRLQRYLTEKFWDTMENRWGKTQKSPNGYNEIFMNASDREIRELDNEGFNEFAVVLVNDKQALCFGSWILHRDVIDYFDISRRNVVTLRVELRGGKNVSVSASDTMKGSTWARDKTDDEVEDYIRSHGYMKRFNILDFDLRYMRA